MDKLIIRKARETDAPAAAGILIRSWSAAYAGLLPQTVIEQKNAKRSEQWKRILAQEHSVYLALENEAPIGLVTVLTCGDEDRPGAGEIGAIYLDPAAWRRGAGRALLAYGEALLKEQGFRAIVLWVLESNARARRFYEACGYAPDGARKESGYGEGIDLVRYAKTV